MDPSQQNYINDKPNEIELLKRISKEEWSIAQNSDGFSSCTIEDKSRALTVNKGENAKATINLRCVKSIVKYMLHVKQLKESPLNSLKDWSFFFQYEQYLTVKEVETNTM